MSAINLPASAETAFDTARNGRPERLLTIDDVARWLGVSKAWVYDHTTRKKPFLPCVRLGEMTRFRQSEVEIFIQEHAKWNGRV
jgi:excisionase family DNA binding protein